MPIRLMTKSDIPAGLRLVNQAGWNQFSRDWERFLSMQPEGCFVAEIDGDVIGTTVACLFDRIAWLAMVLVDEARRGQGIGTALVKHALAFCDASGATSVRLDATALGQPLYEKLGFTPQFPLTRFAGQLPDVSVSSEVAAAQPADYLRLIALDRDVTRTDRGKFLQELFREQPRHTYVAAQGYATVRQGRQAWQLGPCIANSETGDVLLNAIAARLPGEQVYFDAPDVHAAAKRWTVAHGLVAKRHFIRMCRGEAVCEDLDRLWASSGPELG